MAKKAEIKKKKDSLPPIKCKGCDISFIPEDHRQHFHSVACREGFYNRVYFSKTTARKVCQYCSTTFLTTKPGRQVYCKPECREKARKDRSEGIAASLSAERATFLGDRFTALEEGRFRCRYCGKGVRDGVKLDVEAGDNGRLVPVCNLCKEGRDFSSSFHEQKPNGV